MLGWEFPPLVNGGLGVACLGLARALSKVVRLEVIVPQADPAADYPGFRLTGLNHVTAVGEVGRRGGRRRRRSRRGRGDGCRYESFATTWHVPIHLDPYATVATGAGEPEPGAKPQSPWRQTAQRGAGARAGEPAPQRAVPMRPTRRQLDLFRIGDLYGGDLGAKVVEFAAVVAGLARQMDFDLVHAHDWMTFPAGVEVKRATGKPLVLHVHASQYDRAGADARGWVYEVEKHAMEIADRVIPVSTYTAGILASHYGIDPAKIRPVHNGADPVDAFVTRKKFPEKLVLFLGRLTAQKGPEFFMRIASRVLERVADARFVMAGTGEKLRTLIESGAFAGLGGHFHFTGFLDKEKVNRLLSMTDVYCMPSVSEPFGLSALEAAQFGIPAVISRQSGVAEVLRGSLQADFWDVDRMAGHICDLLEDDALRARVVGRARRDMSAATWDAAAAKVAGVYQELV